MTLYQHRFTGHNAAGDVFMFSWWANSTRALAAAQTAAVAWVTELWNGATAGHGFSDHCSALTGVDAVTTVSVDMLTGDQTGRADTGVALPGVSAAAPLPADVALVVSLRTALPRRSGRGRFYLPQATVTDVSSTGRVDAALISDVDASVQGAWTAYNTATDVPVVYSRTLKATNNIVSYDIGDLWDTQRRRENKIIEARTSATMP